MPADMVGTNVAASTRIPAWWAVITSGRNEFEETARSDSRQPLSEEKARPLRTRHRSCHGPGPTHRERDHATRAWTGAKAADSLGDGACRA